MQIMCCAVYDEKAKAFMQPFFTSTTGSAMRMFSDDVGNAESALHKHPEDYSLHLLAVYDPELGVFENREPKAELLVMGLHVSDGKVIPRFPVEVR